MNVNSTLSNSIEAYDKVSKCGDKRKEYDAACKQILSEKIILAWIMKNTMKEYKDFSIKDIANKYIVGTPEIEVGGVDPDSYTSRLYVGGVEDTTITEGKTTFDIRFQAILPETVDSVALIINIEAQKNFYPGYPIIKRAIYYCCRMISSQYGTVFINSHYEKVKKVYSVWICIDPPKERRNTITSYEIKETNTVGTFHENPVDYDLLTAVMICLDSSGNSNDKSLLALLYVLLSNQIDLNTKKQILEQDFQIPITEHFEKGINDMCNLSEYVYEQGIEQGIEQGTLASIKSLMTNLQMSAEEAFKALGIAPDDTKKYLSQLSR